MNWNWIVTWHGVPLGDMPRDKLEQALIDTYRELQEMKERSARASVERMDMLADLVRR